MTAAVIVLAVLLGLAVVWGVLAGTAAYGFMQRTYAAEEALTVERGVVAVQREEIGALALRLIDAGAAEPFDLIRWDTYRSGDTQ